MVFAMLTYCGRLKLKLNKAQENKLTSFHNSAMNKIARNWACEIRSPMTAIKRRACMLTHNILQNNVCHAFSQYFIYQEHSKSTRNNRYRICLPDLESNMLRKVSSALVQRFLMNCHLLQGSLAMFLTLGK